MINVLCTCLPIILMILIGIICRKKEILSGEGVANLKKVALNITLPALLISAFAKLEYSINNIIIVVLMFIVCLLGVFLGKIFQKLFHIDSRYMPYITTGFELGMLGYALFEMLYPGESLGYLASIDIGLTLFANTVYRMMLNKENGTKESAPDKIISDIFKSPIVIAIITGIILGVSGIYKMLIPSGIATVIDSCTDFFGAPTGAIILLTIGYDLVLSDVPWKKVAKTIAARVIIMAVLWIGMRFAIKALNMMEYEHALNVVFILPAAFILPVFADDKGESVYISSSLSVYTILTIVAFVILAALRQFG